METHGIIEPFQLDVAPVLKGKALSEAKLPDDVGDEDAVGRAFCTGSRCKLDGRAENIIAFLNRLPGAESDPDADGDHAGGSVPVSVYEQHRGGGCSDASSYGCGPANPGQPFQADDATGVWRQSGRRGHSAGDKQHPHK